MTRSEADQARRVQWIAEQLKNAPPITEEQREIVEGLLALCLPDRRAA